MKQLGLVLLVGLALGAGGMWLVLRHATAEYEQRASEAEARADVLDATASQALASADSAKALADSIRATPRDTTVITRIRRVAVAAEPLPDTCRPAIDSALAIIADLQGAVFDSGQVIEAKQAEVDMLRSALRSTQASRDTLRNALADRPSAVVTWDWKPKLNGYVTAEVESNGDKCLKLEPELSIWRARARGFAGLCAYNLQFAELNLRQIETEPRLGVAVSMRVF